MRRLFVPAALALFLVSSAPADGASPKLAAFKVKVEGTYSAQGSARTQCLRALPDNSGSEQVIAFGTASETATFSSSSDAYIEALRADSGSAKGVSLLSGRSGGLRLTDTRAYTPPAGCTVDPQMLEGPVKCGEAKPKARFTPSSNGLVAGTRSGGARVPIGAGNATRKSGFGSLADPLPNCPRPDGMQWFGDLGERFAIAALKSSGPTVKKLFSSDSLSFDGTVTGKTCVNSEGRPVSIKPGTAPKGCAAGSSTTYTYKLKVKLTRTTPRR